MRFSKAQQRVETSAMEDKAWFVAKAWGGAARFQPPWQRRRNELGYRIEELLAHLPTVTAWPGSDEQQRHGVLGGGSAAGLLGGAREQDGERVCGQEAMKKDKADALGRD